MTHMPGTCRPVTYWLQEKRPPSMQVALRTAHLHTFTPNPRQFNAQPDVAPAPAAELLRTTVDGATHDTFPLSSQQPANKWRATGAKLFQAGEQHTSGPAPSPGFLTSQNPRFPSLSPAASSSCWDVGLNSVWVTPFLVTCRTKCRHTPS